MDRSKLYVPNLDKLVQFYSNNATGNIKKYRRHSLVTLDTKDKPTTEKMETDLVSPTKRSLDQVTDALKRNKKNALKRRRCSKTKHKSKSRQRHQKQLKKSRKKNSTKLVKAKPKDIFN